MPPRPGPEESPRLQRERSQSRQSHHSQEGLQKSRRRSREGGSPQVHSQDPLPQGEFFGQPAPFAAPHSEQFGHPAHHAAPRSEGFGHPAPYAAPRGEQFGHPAQHAAAPRADAFGQPAHHAAPRAEQFGQPAHQQGSPHRFQPMGNAPPSNIPPSPYHQVAPGEAEEPSELVQCEDCGRSFNPESIDRHRRICKKVFSEKRKQFNSAANRLGEFENAGALVKNAKKIEKEAEAVKKADGKKDEEPAGGKDKKPMPKWKQQSLAFRAAMLASKAAMGDDKAAADLAAVKEEIGEPPPDPNKVTCPHCGRSFNKESAQRHIDICLKTFGSKPGGGRLVRGGGKSCNQTAGVQAKAAAKPASEAKGVGRGRPPAGDPASRRQPGTGAAARVSSQGPRHDHRY